MSLNVEESDLDFRRFRCCGDEDLYPFECPRCGRLMVFCYECDTLHGDLKNLGSQAFPVNNSDPTRPIFSCPGCEYAFEYWFIRDCRYKASVERWVNAGFGHLLNSTELS
ncbi:hypothetical protein VT84_02120 [Gemmata sp. SH-PL17]|uniref:hypothetical protein n=1 Tax=Gemmata sp. SH-PL17 TaxID=1630693 RepID=UPI00078E949D|nr:hypothetical protein [Gemmata sp. SH-PL17]AMV23178.1 hypothetical protein VT84_02120 [Gemmata sp. SH-PL17]